jgi:uncharacterized membrane-anchored protein
MFRTFLLAVLAALFPAVVFAQSAEAVWEAAWNARIDGPADVPLGNQGVYHMDESLAFIPQLQATALMQSWGNSVGPSFMGLVTSKSETERWVVSVDFIGEGFVEDDEAATWDKDALLASLKEGTDAQNEERHKQGMPGLMISGWIEEPSYDKANHRLIWSLAADTEGAAPGDPATVNYNTYALGREGYFEINLMTDTTTIAADKVQANAILEDVSYVPGKAYGDYVEGTDKLASYGIAALVGGGLIAKKAGLFALVGLLLAKFGKVIAIAVAVGGAGLFKLFGRKGGSA